MSKIKIFKWEIEKIHVEQVVKLKVFVSIALVIAHFVPLEYKVPASIAANLVWLWKL